MGDEQNRRPGRPREFEENDVLDAAIETFASRGFAASMSDLTAATGLSAGSLYKAYGNKDGVYASALGRYMALHEMAIADALALGGTARDRIAAVLRLYASWSRDVHGRRGCLVVAGVAETDVLATPAVAALRALLDRRHDLLVELVREGQDDGSVTTVASAHVVADLLLSVLQGMRVLGKGGLFPDDAEPLVMLALRILD